MDVMYSPNSANPCAIKAVNPGPRPNPIIIAKRHRKPPHQKEDRTLIVLGWDPYHPWQSSLEEDL